MSDFDTVLERLLSDPSFAAALSADPDRTLAGYRLDPGERDLLRSQVASGSQGAASTVEARTTKSSTFGLFSSVGEAIGGAMGEVGDAARHGADALLRGPGGNPSVRTGFGEVGGRHDDGGAVSGMGDRPSSSGLGDARGTGQGGGYSFASNVTDQPAHHQAHMQADLKQPEPPKGYANKVDVNGDGTWDKATYVGREDGGVDILVDMNHDGKTDFVGRDFDADWTVDEADYDKNHDGVFEKTMYDDTGDGILDRTKWHKR